MVSLMHRGVLVWDVPSQSEKDRRLVAAWRCVSHRRGFRMRESWGGALARSGVLCFTKDNGHLDSP